jgi:hypothetical protein
MNVMSRKSKQSPVLCIVSILVSTVINLMWITGSEVFYIKGNDLRLTAYECCSWEMALFIGFDLSYDNL